MDEKWTVGEIVSAHWQTLYNQKTEKVSVSDVGVFYVLPLVVAVFLFVKPVEVREVSRLLAGISVFTALLFALVTNVFTLYLRVRRDEGLSPYDPLIADVKELFANVCYSVIVGLGLVLVLIAASATQGASHPLSKWWLSPLAALLLHLVLTVAMSLNRLWQAHLKIGDLPPKGA